MGKLIPVHSFRRGVGKSNIIANLSVLLAEAGKRVGVIDTDLPSPSIHIPFKVNENEMNYTLNDYLEGVADIAQTVHDVTPRLAKNLVGQIFLIPASPDIGRITRILRQGYNLDRLGDSFNRLIEILDLDALMIDTHAGLNEETLLSIAACDTLTVVLRPDQQDYQGTGLTIELARRLEVPRILLIVNEVPLAFDFVRLKAQVEQTYNCEVIAMLPHFDEVMAVANADIFALRYPDHPLTSSLRQVATMLIA
jgi:septum site-determining protein MinD